MSAIVKCPRCLNTYDLNEDKDYMGNNLCWKCHITDMIEEGSKRGIDVEGMKKLWGFHIDFDKHKKKDE